MQFYKEITINLKIWLLNMCKFNQMNYDKIILV